MTNLNHDGQPLNLAISRSRLIDRNIDELIGICKGVLFDGVVVHEEADMLLRWMERNQHAANKWPANILYARISLMLKDGNFDSDEQKELLDLLMEVTGPAAHLYDEHSTSTELPLSKPQPEIVFTDRVFCVTGKFVSGTRKEITMAIETRAGKTKSSPTKDTNYLIIGEVGSRDWIHSTFGRKIEKAVELNNQGCSIEIISEEHWASFIE